MRRASSGGDHAAGGKAPGAIHQHAHAEPEALVARDVLDLLLARGDRFSS